jgi:uncharacterized membrane protein YfcA
MHQILVALIIGLAIGIMVGLTGVGGGALLVIFLDIPPIIAVGTAALFVAATKIGAALSYYKRGHVDTRLVLRMSVGSIPGAVLGVAALAILRAHLGDGVNQLLKILIGVLLVVIPSFAFFQKYLEKTGKKTLRDRLPPWITPQNGAVAVGLVGGFLVGMTSMGSGSIIMVLLVLFYSRTLQTLIGTDIVHSVVLAFVASLGHLAVGDINFQLLAALLLGSIPAAWCAAHYVTSVRTVWLRTVLFSVAGISML